MWAKTVGSVLLVGLVIGPGCGRQHATEIVPGVMSQVQVPRDLQSIRVDVWASGVQKFCQYYSVFDGTVRLPRTLGLTPAAGPSETVTVEIRGYTVDPTMADQGASNGECSGLATTSLKNPGNSPPNGSSAPTIPRVLRRSIQSYVDQSQIFLPMPLRYSCFDTDCCGTDATCATGLTQTCKGGTCVDAHTDPATLVDFDESLVFGDTSLCFSPMRCMPPAASFPAVAVDANNCVYGFPVAPPPGAAGNMNVKVFYRDMLYPANGGAPQMLNAGEAEILDLDPQEGFTLVQGQAQFKLAPGLCTMAKNFANPPPPSPNEVIQREISDIQVTALCPPKTLLQPICAGETTSTMTSNLPDGGTSTDGGCNVANTLNPSPSAVYILMDDSMSMAPEFGMGPFQDVLGFSLTDPAFRNTYVAFSFFPHAMNTCPTAPTSYAPMIPFGLAASVKPMVATALNKSPLTIEANLYLDVAMTGGMNGAYGAVTTFVQSMAFPTINRAAVMFLLNRHLRDPTTSCNPSASYSTLAMSALTAPTPVYTYVVVLNPTDPSVMVSEYDLITTAGGTGTAKDATTPANGAIAFEQIVADLGTCLYDAGGTQLTDVIGYNDPLKGFQTLTRDPSCTAKTAGPGPTGVGWNLDGKQVAICGTACTQLRQALATATGAAAMMDAGTLPDVPVVDIKPCQ